MENVSRNAGGGIESLTTENVTLQAFLFFISIPALFLPKKGGAGRN